MYQDLHVDNNFIFITVNLSMYLLMIPRSKPYKVSNVWISHSNHVQVSYVSDIKCNFTKKGMTLL